MKICTKCNIEKDDDLFKTFTLKGEKKKFAQCKACESIYRKLNYEKNKEKQLAQGARWKSENWERVLKYASDYGRANKARRAANEMKRHARKLKASVLEDCEWNNFYIEEIYQLREIRSKECNTAFEVDHIVPLQGKSVCGLHIWNNLRLITASHNRSKNNSF